MTGKEKLEYLWMYYKIWLLVPVAVIAAIYLGVTMYPVSYTHLDVYKRQERQRI